MIRELTNERDERERHTNSSEDVNRFRVWSFGELQTNDIQSNC